MSKGRGNPFGVILGDEGDEENEDTYCALGSSLRLLDAFCG